MTATPNTVNYIVQVCSGSNWIEEKGLPNVKTLNNRRVLKTINGLNICYANLSSLTKCYGIKLVQNGLLIQDSELTSKLMLWTDMNWVYFSDRNPVLAQHLNQLSQQWITEKAALQIFVTNTTASLKSIKTDIQTNENLLVQNISNPKPDCNKPSPKKNNKPSPKKDNKPSPKKDNKPSPKKDNKPSSKK